MTTLIDTAKLILKMEFHLFVIATQYLCYTDIVEYIDNWTWSHSESVIVIVIKKSSLKHTITQRHINIRF